MHNLEGRLSFHYRKSGAGQNRYDTQQNLYKPILLKKECVQTGVFTIKEMETHMCIYY